MNQRRRWVAVAALLAAGWLATPSAVPLYDGVGFPDEPYRFVPVRGGDGPPARTADVRLRVAGGVNTGGLLANSAELGPQVSVYAPPRAFQLPRPQDTADILLRAQPVPPTDPAPPGELESNVYALSFTSAAGAVSVRDDAQPVGITLRAVTVKDPLPVMQYRPSPDARWRVLATRRVGRDNFNATAPGAGEYALTRLAAVTNSKSGNGGLLLVVGLAVGLMTAVLVAVRLLGPRQVVEE